MGTLLQGIQDFEFQPGAIFLGLIGNKRSFSLPSIGGQVVSKHFLMLFLIVCTLTSPKCGRSKPFLLAVACDPNQNCVPKLL